MPSIRLQARLALLAVLSGIACGGDSRPPTAPSVDSPTPPLDSKVASLQINSPPYLLVNERALLTVIARNAAGVVVPIPAELQWLSSDEATLTVGETSTAGSGVVRALRRGAVTISVSAGSVDAAVSMSVRARVKIAPVGQTYQPSVTIALREKLQLEARFVDVNGETIDEVPSVTWVTSDPGLASVSSTGLVIGLVTGRATVIATSSDGGGAIDLNVIDVIAGLPATVRFAHAASGHGPLTFVPSQGTPVTLAYGESVDAAIESGSFHVLVEGLSIDRENSWGIGGGERFEVFATSYGVNGWWINDAPVPADSGLIRFVQSTGPPNFALVVLLGAPEAVVADAQLIDCYFDPLVFTEYVSVPAGEFDVIMGDKGLFFHPGVASENARGRFTVNPGQAITYVLTGESPQTMRLLAFPDS